MILGRKIQNENNELDNKRKSIKLHDFKAIEMRFEIVEEGRLKMKKKA